MRAVPRAWLADADRPGRLPAAVGLFLAAPLAILVSQALPHTYYFWELGFLFPFTVYDVALALLGLGILCAGFSSERRFMVVILVFVLVLTGLLSVFIPIWQVILRYALDEKIYLVTPFAVGLTGVALWLPERARFAAALVLAAVLAADVSLFIGLNEFSNNINNFSSTSVVAAAWIAAAPAFLLRRFKRPWLTIAGRILGSWLVAIELLIFTFAVVPMPVSGG